MEWSQTYLHVNVNKCGFSLLNHLFFELFLLLRNFLFRQLFLSMVCFATFISTFWIPMLMTAFIMLLWILLIIFILNCFLCFVISILILIFALKIKNIYWITITVIKILINLFLGTIFLIVQNQRIFIIDLIRIRNFLIIISCIIHCISFLNLCILIQLHIPPSCIWRSKLSWAIRRRPFRSLAILFVHIYLL